MFDFQAVTAGLDDLAAGYRRRELWLTLAKDDVRVQYKRTVLGQFWITLAFGFFIFFISFLWTEILNRNVQVFVPWFAIGITTWHVITAAINEGTTTFSSVSGTIHNIPLPLSVHVFRAVTRHLINYAHNFLIVLIVLAVYPPPFALSMLLVLPGYVIIIVAAIAVKLVLGVLGARYRDFSYGVRTLMTPMFFITPILWIPDMLPPERAWLANMNPFTHFIALIREPLLGRVPTLINYSVTIGLMLALTFLGLRLLGKHRWKVPYWIA